jgi:chitodextrinase
VDEPGPATAPIRSADERRRRVRAAVAGIVTSVVVVTGGLIVTAGGGPETPLVTPTSDASSGQTSASAPPPGAGRLGPPTHLAADRGVTTVSLAWDPPADPEPPAVDHYEIFRDGRRIGRAARPRFDVTGLTFGTRYRFWVVAVDGDGRTSRRNLRTVTTTVPPVASARLSGTYTVTAVVSDAADGGRVRFLSHPITWSLVPQCPDRACDVSYTATHRFGSGSVVTSGVLAWSGGTTYTATWVGRFGTSCVERKLEALSTLTITVRAASAHVVGGLWVASAIDGSIHERVRGCGGAPTATYGF